MREFDSYIEDQDELEEVWASCISKYEKLWGSEGCDFLSTVPVCIHHKAEEANALALTFLSDRGLMVSFNPLITALDSDTYIETVLHEMCHCMAYFDEKTLAHDEDWYYYVNKLNKNAGYNITETMGEDQLIDACEESFEFPEFF